jgi:hypothetical protein
MVDENDLRSAEAVCIKELMDARFAALTEHVESAVRSITDASVAADRLSVARREALDHRIETAILIGNERLQAVRREMELITEAAAMAIAKAEVATEKRFESVNEWRGQSADRERTMQEQNTALATTYLPREVAEAQFAEFRRTLVEMAEKIGKLV